MASGNIDAAVLHQPHAQMCLLKLRSADLIHMVDVVIMMTAVACCFIGGCREDGRIRGEMQCTRVVVTVCCRTALGRIDLERPVSSRNRNVASSTSGRRCCMPAPLVFGGGEGLASASQHAAKRYGLPCMRIHMATCKFEDLQLPLSCWFFRCSCHRSDF